MTDLSPEVLPDNRVPVYYAGGEQINAFRHLDPPVQGPEDWIGSLVPLPRAILGPEADPTTGVSRLGDGRSLADVVAADPVGWLGSDLATAFDGSSGLLVKLLDAGERLPVHCHPTRAFAQRNLGSIFGKTEGWLVMRAQPDAAVWLGMGSQVDVSDLRAWIDRQDVDSMLAAMVRVPVRPGDVLYVPAGVPHSIGPGVMITELQEPTSFSVLAEYEVFGVDADAATLGLGWDLALSCFDLSDFSNGMDRLRPEARVLVHSTEGVVTSLFGSEADGFFRAYRIDCKGRIQLPEPCFGVLVIVDGAGEMAWPGGHLPVRGGYTLVVPFGAGPITFTGDLAAFACLPPVVS